MLHTFAGNHVYSTGGQCLVMLLVGLQENGGGTRKQVLFRIRNNQWFALQQEDFQSYGSQDAGTGSRWENLISWARKHLDIHSFMFAHDDGHWQLNSDGKELAKCVKAEFLKQEFRVHYCYLFSPVFKRHLDPLWQLSGKDMPRPKHMYRDWKAIETFAAEHQPELDGISSPSSQVQATTNEEIRVNGNKQMVLNVKETAMSINELIVQLLELKAQPASAYTDVESMTESLSSQQRLEAQILDHILRHPGKFICIPEARKRTAAQEVVETLWKEEVDDNDEFYRLIHYGVPYGGNSPGRCDSISDGLGTTYHLRVRQLKPTFVSNNLPADVRCCFEQAMEAWVRGLDSAALILCWSVLESLMKERLLNIDTDLVYQSAAPGSRCRKLRPWPEIIKSAKNLGILNAEGAAAADDICKTRNNAVHELKDVTEDQSFRAITNTRWLLEFLVP